MREIKFRGKRPNSGKWIYGYYVRIGIYSFIINKDHPNCDCSTEVIPETVGQYTGLKDKNGTEIYEGDICEDYAGRIYLIEWHNGGFWINGMQNGAEYNLHRRNNDIKIIGNIHDNPELLTENNGK